MRVLVVDDEVAIRDLIGACLREACHCVVVVATIADAIRELEMETTDAVVTDLQLLHESGLDLVVVADVRWPLLPFVLISGSFDPASLSKAGELRVSTCLPKPFRMPDLLAAVARAHRSPSL
jgi:DNA-binding NtrC family response regulator